MDSRGVAQPGRVLAWGARGRRFDSCHPDHKNNHKMRKAILYLHGKGGSANEAEFYKPFFPSCDVIGVDYRDSTPWKAAEDIISAYRWVAKQYNGVSVVANSIGAYFGMLALSGVNIEHAYFISPVVDLEHLILDLMAWSNVNEQELLEKKIIVTQNWTEPLSWEYLKYVREHPITWRVSTDILYGEKDVLIPFETITKFVKHSDANITVMKGGEHWFHTNEQVKFHDAWLKRCVVEK